MKRLALFGATVLVPCAVLVVFGYVMIRQDRELALRQADDRRRAAEAQHRQNRLAQLERMKQAAAADFFAGRKPEIEFAALVSGGTVRAPWEEPATAATPSLDACERDEFAPGKLAEAIACYRREAAQADPRRTAHARLLLGRALAKSGDHNAAANVNHDLLRAPFLLADDQGVPYAHYAADRLLRAPAETALVSERFRQHDTPPTLSPPAALFLKDIAARLSDATLQQQAAAALHFANHVESLRADLDTLLPQLRSSRPEPVWLAHQDWQIGLARTPESGKELLVAIASSRLPPGSPAAPQTPTPPRTGIYLASLCLVFVIAASGSYLLWRDVRRDLEVAALRAQFVSSVSHELKTPLTAIRMFAETLRIRSGNEALPREQYLGTIIHESERLSRLVDNVLEFSKIEQGRKLYHLRSACVEAVLDSVVRVVRYPLEQAGVVLKTHVAAPLPEVNADPDALQQALLNLIMNAVKYSRDRKEIELTARSQAGSVVIGVRDYGAGIPIEHRQRIFDRFYRVPSEENQRVPGAGLGLTLVAHIAKAHGGDVTVESAPGAGSLFALRLPVEKHA